MAERFVPQYVADRVLGEGAFGKVYLVHNQRAEDFALKVWKTRDSEALEKLRAEVSVLSRLSHPNLLRLHEFLPQVQGIKGVADKGPGIVMDYVEGEDLVPGPGVAEGREFSEWLELLAQCLRGLDYLHRRHLIHGDLKPSNVRIAKKGQVKILDFSLASRLEETPASGEVAGTWDYLAPEIFRGERSSRSDLFSLGVLFYELLANKKPYDPALDLARRFAISPLPLHEIQKKVPAYFSQLLSRLLETDPQRRFASARGVLRALNRHLEKPFDLGAVSEGTDESGKIPFVGREEILQGAGTLLREWSAEQRRFPLLILRGPVGIGKTRLAEEIALQALLRGLKVRALPAGDLPSLTAEAAPLEKTLIHIDDLDRLSVAEGKQFLARLRDLKVRSPELGFLLSWNEPHQSLGGQELRQSLAELGDFLEFPLPPLSQGEAATLVEEILDLPEDAEPALAVMQSLCEGNPALLIDLARWAQAQKISRWNPRDRHWEKTSLPESLREDLRRHWERLDLTARETLAAAVLLRESFSLKALSTLMGKPEEALLPSLEALANLGWMDSEENTFRFRKPLFRGTFLDLFGDSKTLAFRGRIFAFLREQRNARPHVLAELAKALGEKDAFVTFGVQAAEKMLEQGDPESAISLFGEVLRAHPPREQEAHVQAYLAAAFSRLSRFEEAMEAYKKWYETTTDDGSGVQTIKYHYLMGNLLANWGKGKKAQLELQKALQTSEPAHEQHLPFQLKAISLLGKLLEQEGKGDEALAAYQRGLQMARGDSVEKAQLLRNLGVYWLNQGEGAKGKAELSASLRLSQSLRYEEGVIHAAFLLASQAQREGRHAEALELYGKALEIAEKNRDILKIGQTQSNLAAVLIEMADYSHAEEQALKAQGSLENLGKDADRFLNRFHLGTIQTYLGQFGRPEDPELIALTRRLKRGDFDAYLSRLKGEGARLRRDFQGALQAYAEARELFRKAKLTEEAETTALLAAFTECLAGDPAAARAGLPEPISSHPLKPFFELAAKAFNWTSSPGLGELEAAFAPVLSRPEQEWVILALGALSELLLRLGDQEAAEWLKQKAYEWLSGLHRSLPEEMQLTFEGREDFQRLAELHRSGLKSTGISRERFLTFARINQRLSETTDMHAILEQVMDAAMSLAGADRGFLLIGERKKPTPVIPGFRVETARNMKQENVASEEFKISLSVIQEALRRRVTILTDNAQADPKFKHAESVHLYGLKSILVLPLLSEKECVGVIYLDHRFAVGAFSDEAMMFLKTFADQSVLAVEKARRLADLARANRSLAHRVEEQAHRIENLEAELHEARKNLRFGYEEIIGHSPKMIQILQMLDRITDTRIPVWIHGESGTGKELIARALHFNSDRKDKPFIAENCSAIPENLLESVLFGHVRGAFTHAEKDRMGLFEAANAGTIFLDEIGDMPISMQAKLLRVLQEGEVRRVGANQSVKIDVRVLSATNKDLPGMVKRGEFREDLYFRLNGMRVNLPPLRERKEDIPLLAQHFAKKVAEENKIKSCPISEDALKILAKYEWPGNIRELENTLRNALIFSDGKAISAESLGFKPELFAPPAPKVAAGEALPTPSRILEGVEREREAILDAMVKASYHKGLAAKELNVTPRHLYNLLEKYELPKNKWALKKLVEEERGG